MVGNCYNVASLTKFREIDALLGHVCNMQIHQEFRNVDILLVLMMFLRSEVFSCFFVSFFLFLFDERKNMTNFCDDFWEVEMLICCWF